VTTCPKEWGLGSLGEHSLKGLSRPEWAEETLEAAATAGVAQLPRASTAASLCMFLGRAHAAVGYAETAVALEVEPGFEPFAPGWASMLEAGAHLFAGRPDLWLEICGALTTRGGVAEVAGLCGMLHMLPAVGRGDEARAIAERTLTAARGYGNPFFALVAYGRAFSSTEPARALAVLREGLDYTRRQRVLNWEGHLAAEAASVEAACGNLDEAFHLFGFAIDTLHRAGNQANLAVTLADLALVFGRMGRPDVAATIYGASSHDPGTARVLGLVEEIDRLRSTLGEAVFDGCVAAGAVMEPGEAVRYARAQIQAARRALPALARPRPDRPAR